MTAEEHYIQLQGLCGIVAGDQVRVTRIANARENGWGTVWVPNMDEWVGKLAYVQEIDADEHTNNGMRLTLEQEDSWQLSWWFPYFALEKVVDQPVVQATEEEYF